MHFIDEAPLYKLTRITGPQHNYLGLQITLHPTTQEPTLEALDQGVGNLRGPDILQEVLRGVDEASLRRNTRFYVEKIQYISTDSAPVSIYRQLAFEIAQRIDVTRLRSLLATSSDE